MTDEERVLNWYKKFPPLTPWFGAGQDPVHAGVYMVDQAREGPISHVFAYWDGQHWYAQDSLPEKAARWVCYGPIKWRFRQWRGLQEKAK